MRDQSKQIALVSTHWGLRALRWLGGLLPPVGGIIAFGLMVGLFFVAFWSIFRSLLHIVPSSGAGVVGHASEVDRSAVITVHVLHGVELFLLAPLPFLVFLSLARYVETFLHENGVSVSEEELAGCELRLLRVKTLVVSLMTASVATDLLRRSIETVSLPVAAAEGLIMVLLGSYWFALEKIRLSHRPITPGDTKE